MRNGDFYFPIRIMHAQLDFIFSCSMCTYAYRIFFEVRMRNGELHLPIEAAHTQRNFSCPRLELVTLRTLRMGRKSYIPYRKLYFCNTRTECTNVRNVLERFSIHV